MTPEHQAAETALRVALDRVERQARLFFWFYPACLVLGIIAGAALARVFA